MQVLFLASEVAPWSKTGGLADVAGALPMALAGRGHRVMVISPHYAALQPSAPRPSSTGLRVVAELGAGPVVFEVLEAVQPPVRWLFLQEDSLFGRAGLYGEGGSDYPDNAVRFGAFCAGALATARALGRPPDILHAHDWQTAPAILQSKLAPPPRPPSVFTIHNLAFQGLFPADTLGQLGWPAELFSLHALEFFGRVSLLKAGLVFGDALTTVSPTYADEICTPEHGCGLDGLLRARRPQLRGVLNGIDTFDWDPRRDRYLPAHFSLEDLRGKARCKAALQRELGLREEPGRPLFVTVSRLSPQKGIDLLLGSLDRPLLERAQVAILGSGDAALEAALRDRCKLFPGALAARLGFDEALAHRLEAGGDFFVMPSRFEPCGLNQMYSLRYGTLPIVRATGGLADTVRDAGPDLATGTGFTFGPAAVDALQEAQTRALDAYEKPRALEALRRRAMAEDNSWEVASAQYDRLYRLLAA